MKVSTAIRDARQKFAISEEQAAKALGVSVDDLQKFERGEYVDPLTPAERAIHDSAMIHVTTELALKAYTDNRFMGLPIDVYDEDERDTIIRWLIMKHNERSVIRDE